MASLTGNQINNTYCGLIKTDNNGAVGVTSVNLTDGVGNPLCVNVCSTGTTFTGDVDFTGASVTGLPAGPTGPTGAPGPTGAQGAVGPTGPTGGGGGGGLVAGTGTDSMKNDDSLVTNPATAAGACSIALGDNASADGASVAIGVNTVAPLPWSVAIGRTAVASAGEAVAIGNNACGSGVSVGGGAKSGAGGTSIGICTCGTAAACAVNIGFRACSSANHGVAIGSDSNACALHAISIAGNTQFTNFGSFATGAIAIGTCSCSNATCSIALGFGVTATRANALTTCEYVACAVGKGIVVTSPDGLTTLGIGIDNGGNIVTYTP